MLNKTKLSIFVFITILIISACGAPATEAVVDATEAPATEQVEAAAFPVTIEHKFGSTTIDSQPKNVVTVGWNDQDFVLALGVIPVTTRAWFDEYSTYPWIADTLGNNELPAIGGDINFEAIAAEKPDVILAIYEEISQETYDKLAQIAPTVVQSADYLDGETPWDIQTLTTGKAIGKFAEAQALVEKVNAKIEEVKTAHPEFADKVLVVDYGPEDGGHWLIAANDPRRALFDALGFVAQEEKFELSEERLDLLDRDVLLIVGATEAEMLKSPLFAQLNVVTSGQTLYTAFDTPLAGALSYSGPEAMLYALDILVPQLAAALDGDPTTKP